MFTTGRIIITKSHFERDDAIKGIQVIQKTMIC